jgi:hypothetical protein
VDDGACLSCPALAKELCLPRLTPGHALSPSGSLVSRELGPGSLGYGLVWFGLALGPGPATARHFHFPFPVTSRAMTDHGMGFLQKNTTPVISLVLSFVNLILVLTLNDFVAIVG